MIFYILNLKSLNRLGRNKQMILDELQELIKINIVVMDIPLLDTRKYKDMNGLENLISDLILQLLSYMAEDERKRVKERQEEGIKIAISNGIKFGRKKIMPNENFKTVYDNWKQGKINDVKALSSVNRLQQPQIK